MDCLNLNKNVCRICLDHNAVLNWNDEVLEFYGISYKDCYYKYTQLNESDSDCLPKKLCEICADDLKNAHFLFDKALESFNVLQATLADKKLNTKYTNTRNCNNELKVKYEIHTSNDSNSISLSEINNATDDESQIDYLSSASDNELIAESGNGINEISMIEKVTIEPVHFIDIQNFESSDENLLEQKLIESCDVALPTSSAANKDRKTNNRCKSLTETYESQHNKTCDAKLKNSTDTKETENKRKKYELESSLEQNLSASSSQADRRKKYILICQYCSLKVNGIHHLRKHEATHCENRERNQTCPQCGIKLYTKLSLTEHMKIHKENRQKNHQCEFCEKAFFNKGALNVHRRIHLGLMVKCPICLKEYYRQVDLDKHLLKHSASPLERSVGKVKYTIQCQYCDKSVLTLKWREHKAAHLGQPEVKCKICDKNFFSRKKCVKHLQRLHRKRRGSNCFPENLCEICANDLKNAHFLFDKALESFNVLQAALTNHTNIEICNNRPTVKSEIHTSNESKSISLSEINATDDEAQIEYLPFATDDQIIGESENGINEISMIEKVTIEPVYFMDIKNFKSTDENLLEQNQKENCDVELPSTSSAASKERKTSNRCVSLAKTFEQQFNKTCDAKLTKSTDTKEIQNKRKNSELESSLEQTLSASSNIKSLPPASTKQAGRRKKYYVLICQYCSLKVIGTHHLKRHEATHFENRERKETCPQCGIKMYDKFSLTAHMKIHKENRQRIHQCEFCEKSFFKKGNLNVHRRIHLGLMVKCPICSREFYRQIDLDKHLLKHSASPLEKNVGEVKYTIQCQYCDKSVLTRRWREHKAEHLGQPQVKCKICDKDFFSRIKCAKHLQRLHRKRSGEYQDLIHYYVDFNTRMSHLKIKQDGKVQLLIN